jgi:hypothetical protein
MMGYSPILDLDATKAMIEQIFEDYMALLPAQTDYASHSFGTDTDQGRVKQWQDFESLFGGTGANAKTNDGLSKSDIRGNGTIGDGGLLGMCAAATGWNLRPPVKKVNNVVVTPPFSPDGRMEWELKGAPPMGLVKQLGNYYPDLPGVTIEQSKTVRVSVH